ncbi:MAG: lactonase family protein [Cyclobacteriaceae bacterium]
MIKTTLLYLAIIMIAFSCNQQSPKTAIEQPQPPKEMNDNLLNIFIGTYTSPEGSKGIYQVKLDTEKGEFGQVELVAETVSPSFLALNKDKTKLYAANETVPDGVVTAFERSEGDTWKSTSKLPSLGDAPCHVTTNDDESIIVVANYVTGNVTAYPLNSNGDLVDQATTGQHEGVGPNAARQEAPHAHFVQFSKDQKFLYAVDLGIDEIKAYPVGENGLGESVTAIQLTPGDGPRHFVFHPTKDIAYIVNELTNTVIAANVDIESGQFSEFDRKTTLPEDFTEHSQCAAIKISKDGRFLYASNRGHQSIAIYALAADGSMELLEVTSTEGAWPRDFMLTPDGKHMLVANEQSDNIVLFNRDLDTGLLTYSGKQINVSKPVCLIN